jgi:hypothetical protein
VKRILAAVAALSLAVSLALPAHAVVGAVSPRSHWVERDLTWPVVCLTCPGGFSSPDSGVVRMTVAAYRADTTNAISLLDWTLPPPTFAAPVWTSAVESLGVAQFILQPSGNPSFGTAADSLYLVTQVSIDGVGWTTVTATRLFNTGVTNAGQFILEQGTSNCFVKPFNQAIAITGLQQTAFTGTAPTEYQMLGYRFIRFITCGSVNASGEYLARVGYWSSYDNK